MCLLWIHEYGYRESYGGNEANNSHTMQTIAFADTDTIQERFVSHLPLKILKELFVLQLKEDDVRWLQLPDKNKISSDSADILTSKDSCKNVRTDDYSETLA